jgi:UDP-N-acetylmuramate--alanine ligase
MYYFIGIKGAGMSALAQIMTTLGYQVEGSDVDKKFFTEEGLIKSNIKVNVFDENNIKEDMIIVRGLTFDEENVEVKKAMELGLKIYTYPEMVGKLTKKFKTICIAGCHGKTTTTSMMAKIFDTIKGSSYIIGDGTGYADKTSEYFILESCEYRRHFLNYIPYYAVITNIDFDHADYFEDIDDVISAYQEYANNATNMVIACGDDPYTHTLEVSKPIFYYGLSEDNDIIAKDIIYKKDGISFDVFIEDNFYGHYDLPIYGKHMLLDALAVIAVAYYERLDYKEVSKIFKDYTGAKRRFTETVVGKDIIIDDYAHHPNEVKATINAIKQKYENKKIVAIFQPHTFSRTKEIKEELVKELNKADIAYVLDIHPSREKQEDFEGITSNIIIDNLDNGNHINMDEGKKLVTETETVYVFMSPNDLSVLEEDLIKQLKDNL